MQRICGDDRVIALLRKLRREPVGEIRLNQRCVRHFFARQSDHTRGKILSGDIQSLHVKSGGQRARAEADVENISRAGIQHAIVNRIQNLLVARERIRSAFIGKTDAFVVSVRP